MDMNSPISKHVYTKPGASYLHLRQCQLFGLVSLIDTCSTTCIGTVDTTRIVGIVRTEYLNTTPDCDSSKTPLIIRTYAF